MEVDAPSLANSSDIGITIVSYSNSVSVFLTSLSDGSPISNANVSLYKKSLFDARIANSPTATALSSKDGRADFSFVPSHAAFAVVSWNGKIGLMDNLFFGDQRESTEAYKGSRHLLRIQMPPHSPQLRLYPRGLSTGPERPFS